MSLMTPLLLVALNALAQAPAPAERPAAKAPAAAPAATPTVSGPLLRSDRPFSPRSRESSTKWQGPFEAFHANRILWTYAGPAMIPEASRRSVPVQCTVDFWVPESQPDKEQMVCTSPRGGYGGFKADSAHAGGALRRPDINSPAWRAYQLKSLQRLISLGCTSFQQDVPLLNVQMLQVEGCYSDGSISGFREYLGKKLTAAEKSALGIGSLDNFDPRTSTSPQVKKLFADFQKESTAGYHAWLHQQARDFAKRDILFSGNIPLEQLKGGGASWLTPHFDFLISEVRASRAAMPETLRELARASQPFKSPSAVTFVTNDVALNQRAIASAYALGLVPIAPWDVYVAPGAPRFFGNAGDFAPLYQVVKDNAALFDGFESRGDWYGTYEAAAPDGGAKDYLITVRENAKKPGDKVIHIVNWGANAAMRVRLKRSAFPVAPNSVITPSQPKPARALASVAGDEYVYSLGDVPWAILIVQR